MYCTCQQGAHTRGRPTSLAPGLLNYGQKIFIIDCLRYSSTFNNINYSLLKAGWSVFLPYLPTQWCRVLLEKLNGLQLVKKFPAFHGTRRFITALTSVRHPSVSWASPIQSIYPHSTSLRSIVILSTHLRLSLASGLLPSSFPSKTLYTISTYLKFTIESLYFYLLGGLVNNFYLILW